MGLKSLIFLSHTLLLILYIECASEIGSHSHIRCIPRERQALLKLKSSFQSLKTTGPLESWGREDHEDDCCKWSGVECSNTTDHVTRLDLSMSYYTHMIGASLADLRQLRYLNLSNNDHYSCQIPEFIGHLSKLEELDLSQSSFGGSIPPQLGNLSLLKFLNLSHNDFNGNSIPESFKFFGNLVHLDISNSEVGGKIRDQLRNLSKLQFLDLSCNVMLSVNRFEWLSHLYSLQYLRLDDLDLSKAIDWGQSLMNLPHLTELYIIDSDLPPLDAAASTMAPGNASSSLSVVDLSGNSFTSSVFEWLIYFNGSLTEIHLQGNPLQGPIPNEFGNMPFLFDLDISNSELEGELPSSFGCPPGKSPSLRYLILSNNRLRGNLSNSITQLHNLRYLDLSSNSFYGIIFEDHLSNFTNLKHLFLSSNSLTLGLGPYWIPQFQLYAIGLSSCNLGPQFPSWLKTQTSFYFLDVSSNHISGSIPVWFWTLSSKALHLNISKNKFHGEVPNEAFSNDHIVVIDLSFNHFEGRLPLFNPDTFFIDLSKNNFTGTSPTLCNFTGLFALDLSDNYLSGELPQCWKESNFFLLNLSNNNLTGNLQNTISSADVSSIQCPIILQLRNNNFTGELPSSLSQCTDLRVLDVASNMISGSIPEWIGNNLSSLQILILRSNRFSGTIPPNLCWLQLVQVMDLSRNNLTGSVVSCLHNSTVLTGKSIAFSSFVQIIREKGDYDINVMTSLESDAQTQSYYPVINESIMWKGMKYEYSRSYYLKFNERIMWKGVEYEYNRNLKDMVMVDFSSNKLQGEIPEEYGSLVALIQLNLSNNNLCGRIPKRIGEMRNLEVLDLSSNHLSGEIPQSISKLSFLDKFDLSNNGLTGQIPICTQLQTQSAAVFMGNPGLCGDPLPKKCHQAPTAPSSSNYGGHEEKDEFISKGFYMSMGVGFVIGFWGVLGPLLFHNSWSSAYFRFLNNAADWMYVRSGLIVARMRRRRWSKHAAMPESWQ